MLNFNYYKCMIKNSFLRNECCKNYAHKLLLIMKISSILLLVFTFHLAAEGYSQNAKIKLNFRSGTISEIIEAIENQTEFKVFYKTDQVDVKKLVSITQNETTLSTLLDQTLEGSNLTYTVMNNLLVITPSQSVAAQLQKVTGKVLDSKSGEPLPGVNVTVQGTTIGTVTDLDGKYSLEVADGNAVLIFSFVGYVSQNVTVGTSAVIDVQMEEDIKSLEEVVVVGYGVQKKSLVTGAISKVNSDELVKGSSLRVTQAIQGKTAGVFITNTSGQPGSFVSVKIRGIGTNGDTEPLYIVDGLPSNGHGIDYLNASDVESIEVLKDAASAAIYGARGANGVVLITTKTGKKNSRFQVSLDSYYGVQNPWKKLNVLEPKQYFELMNESAANAGQAIPFPTAITDTLKHSTDWQDQMFSYNAPKQNHVISFTGGGEKTTFSSSLSYYSQDGIVAKNKSNFDRTTWRLNTEHDLGLFKLGTNFTLAQIKNNGIDANDKYGMSLAQAINMPPMIPVYMADGTFATPGKYGVGMQEITNPVGLLSIRNNDSETNKIVGGLSADFDISKLIPALKGLKFRSAYSTEYAFVNYRSYDPLYYLSSTKYTTVDKVNMGYDKYVTWNIDNVLSYDKTLGNHHFTLMAGQSSFRNYHVNLGATKADLIFKDLDHAYIANATDDKSTTAFGGYDDHTMLSYFGRVNYDFSGKYMLTATMRRDGSSRFGSANKFGSFPSVSAGWNISNEEFFPKGSAFSQAKLRASWGRNGNESIGDFRYTTTMSNGNIYYFGTTPVQVNGVQPSSLSNPNLKWETSQQADFAVDLGFFDNRITLTLDYYSKKTIDWLVTAPISQMAGNSAPVINGGDMRNNGFEYELTIRQKVSDVDIRLSLTGAINKNEMVDIKNAEKVLSWGDGGFGQSGILRAEVGKPFGFFYGYKVDGVFQNWAEVKAYADKDGNLIQPNAQPGDFRFKDIDGDGKLTDSKDRTMLGNPIPDFTGGANLDVEWKGFDLNMFWYAALGQQNWMALRRYDQPYTNYTDDFYKNRWTGEGTSNTYPRVTHVDSNNNLKLASDFYVKDASYVRLKTITLGYTIPKSLTTKIRIAKIRFFVTGENMLTFTKYPGYEPESQGIDLGLYPQPRSILGGLSVTF